MMSIEELVVEAQAAASLGRDHAAPMWQRVIDHDPDHPQALNALGNWLLGRGRGAEARPLLERAAAADPDQPALHFNHAAACAAAADLPAAIEALDRALAIDPYFVQAIFQKALLVEQLGRRGDAARLFDQFLATAPPEIIADPRFAAPIAHARAAVAADREALAAIVARGRTAPGVRAHEALETLLGRGRIYVAEPTFLTVPRLPAIPFFDRALAPWLDEVEAAADAIAEEAAAVIADDVPGGEAGPFIPYVANPPGTPLNQWRALDHSPDWGALFLWKHGVRDDANCRRCPRTAALLDRMPMPRLAGRAPNAMFSLLRAGTRIPPHTGVTNLRSTVHLPLIVPEGCGFRVGAETREWVPGNAWMFDDTIEHEAWNDGGSNRLILIFDVFNPFVEPDEQRFFAELLEAYDSHYGRGRGMSDTL